MPRLAVYTDSDELVATIAPICQNGGWEVLRAPAEEAEAVLIDRRDGANRGVAEQVARQSPFTPVILVEPPGDQVNVGADGASYLDPAHLDDLQHILLSFSLSMPGEWMPMTLESHPVPRILIVDDNLQLAIVIERALRSMEKYDVRVVTSGYEAAAALPSFHPDVAVIDLALGDVDGRDICAFIRKHEKLQNTRIIAMSGYLSEDRLEEGQTQPCYDTFIEKPFRVKDLLEKILSYVTPVS